MELEKNMISPIRVLHVVTYMGRGGLETMIMNYYRNIDRSKVQFDFLTHRDFKADYDDEIEELGGKIYRLPRLVPWGKTYHKALDCFFRHHPEYRIIHVHQDCLSSVILKEAKKYGVKVRIAHSHSSNQDKNLKYFIKLFYKRQIPKYSTELFACSKKAGDWMFNGEPFKIINNAIDTKIYEYNEDKRSYMRQQLSIKPNSFVIGHVGRFDAVKNHTFLLDIFAKINEQLPDSILLLVGDGELKKCIEGKVFDLGLEHSVIFTGVRNDVPDLMQAMDCFVFPSVYEGIGIAAIEAQASGLPCVVSTGVPIECNKTGLMVQVSLNDSSSLWSKKIIKHIDEPRLVTSSKIIEAGYDIVENAQWLQNYYLEQWKKEI